MSFFHSDSIKVCPESVVSVDSIRVALGVRLVPDLASGLRQKSEEKTSEEKTGPAQPGENPCDF